MLSGTAFTVPRAANRRSWLYRIPAVGEATARASRRWTRAACGPHPAARARSPPPCRFAGIPIPVPSGGRTDFLAGLRTVATGGDAAMQAGIASHVFVADASMDRRYFQDADGELLVVPQQGRLRFLTELGILVAEPGEVVLIPRGVRFRVELPDGPARGYVCENYGTALTLPERGPIGANGLANERDFLYPAAAYRGHRGPSASCLSRRGGGCSGRCCPTLPSTWWPGTGTSRPFKYDLRRFSPVGATLLDHPDPSIFTVLTAPVGHPGHRQRRLRHLPRALARDGGPPSARPGSTATS